MSTSLQPHGLYSPWNSPGQNTWVGSLSLLQGIFPNPGIEPKSPTLRADFLPAEPQGSRRILEWVGYPFSSGSSRPRNRVYVNSKLLISPTCISRLGTLQWVADTPGSWHHQPHALSSLSPRTLQPWEPSQSGSRDVTPALVTMAWGEESQPVVSI